MVCSELSVWASLLTLIVLYGAAMVLGLVARYRRRSFGRWHHVLFGCTCLAFCWSAIRSPGILYLPLAAVLVMLPLTRPRMSRRHDMLALAGAVSLIILVACQ